MIGTEESTEIITLTMHALIVHDYSMDETTTQLTAIRSPSRYLRT